MIGGHTHVQFDRRVARWRYVNVGAVGRPYEGRPGAYWALLGPDVELLRTEYDVEAAAAVVRASGQPNADDVVETLLDSADRRRKPRPPGKRLGSAHEPDGRRRDRLRSGDEALRGHATRPRSRTSR